MNPSIFGQTVTFTATVTPVNSPAPTGTVQFTANGSGITGCTAVTLTSGTAQCATAGLAIGTNAIVATYSGDSNYNGTTGTLSGGQISHWIIPFGLGWDSDLYHFQPSSGDRYDYGDLFG